MRASAGLARNFLRVDSPNEQCIGDQGTVTAPGHGFGTHDGCRLVVRNANQLAERLFKFGGLHVIGIAAKARIAPSGIYGIAPRVTQSAKSRHVQVMNAGVAQGSLKLVLSELRIVPGARDGTHVNELPNAVSLKECDKVAHRPGGVPHRPYRGWMKIVHVHLCTRCAPQLCRFSPSYVGAFDRLEWPFGKLLKQIRKSLPFGHSGIEKSGAGSSVSQSVEICTKRERCEV